VKQKKYLLLIIALVALLAAGIFYLRTEKTVNIQNYNSVSRRPQIKPDYTDITIPVNIAALNFIVSEKGTAYFVKIHATNGQPIEVFDRKGKIRIPLKPWKALLQANPSEKLFFDIYVRNENGFWNRYQTITNTIAAEPIDSHVAYRLMKTIYNFFVSTAVYQRDLETFNESLVVHGKSLKKGCVNCHNFRNNDPDDMALGFRSGVYGSGALLTHAGKANKIGTKFGHTAWHPTGKVIVYSMYNVRQFFHLSRPEVRDVVELDSTLFYYTVDPPAVKTITAISKKDQLETHPTWSPDGRYLYFCSAPMLWTDRQAVPPVNYEKVKYSMYRISYDIQTDKWGELETVLSSDETGLSILQPRISPDGRFLMFTMCQYSCFPLFQPNSDYYMMEMETRQYRKMENINSEHAEAWHGFSANGRWVVFATKRPEGTLTRLYFSYIDQDGLAHKPFIMPQKDPAFYDSFVLIYNVPEFITGPIKLSKRTLVETIRSPEKIDVEIPIVTGATPSASGPEPWQQAQ